MKDDFVKKIKNDIYLSDNDISILKRNDILYDNFSSMKDLMFYIEELVNDNDSSEELEDLLIKLSEYNYYFRTNK